MTDRVGAERPEALQWTRRRFTAGSACATTPLVLSACSPVATDVSYTEATRNIWRPEQPLPTARAPLLEALVRCATLAPSSHNTQCWKFVLHGSEIAILPDYSRRCPAVDPDDHHLFVSLGCAAENLAQAASARGLQAETRFDSASGDVLRIRLVSTAAVASELSEAMFERQCTRSDFDGHPLSVKELHLLERAGTGTGVRILMLADKPAIEKLLAHVVEANTEQMADPAFVEELKHWIRFNGNEAVRSGDGLFVGASGTASTPRWLGDFLFSRLFTPARENDKYASRIRSSAGMAIFVSERSDKAHWIEAGRCYQRFALQATALGIRNAFLNQPVEVPGARHRLAGAVGLGDRRPDLIVRFGRGPLMPRSLRRPVAAVLTTA